MLKKFDQYPNSELIDLDNIVLSDLIDIPAVQELVNCHYALTGIAVGILDLKGNILVGKGWQDVCTKFHRVNSESCNFCHESDIFLSSGVIPGSFKAYRCKNNMWDVATPIMIGEKHIGNIFTGQFIYDDENPDYELFRSQAKRFGYDMDAYIEALDRVPRFSREFVNNTMSFYANLAQMISRSNYNNLMLKNAIIERRKKEIELKQLNRTLKASTHSMHAMMSAKGEEEYLNEVCRIIAEDCGHAMVWIGYNESDDESKILPVARADDKAGYLETKDYASSVIFPLKRDGKTFGSLFIYSKSVAPFSETELELLKQLSERLAYGITMLRLRSEKEKIDQDLRESERDLREAVSARDEFLSIASHELRTPLTALHLQLELISRMAKNCTHGEDTALSARSEKAIKAQKHLAKLIDDLLDITRIRAGKLELNVEEMNLAEKVIDVVNRMSENAIKAGSIITVSAPAPIPGRWDSSRIDQIVTNLLSNAIKYGNGLPVEVSVSADSKNKIAKISVQDFGLGISEELHSKIFERFERAVSSKEISGLGLGLYIVHQLVEAHGGTINVSSVVNQGSLFTVELPLI